MAGETSQQYERRTFLKTIGAGSVVAMAGCSSGQQGGTQTTTDDGGGGPTEDDETTTEASSGTDQSSVPEFVWLMTGSIPTIDPARATDNPRTVLAVNFYDNLITTNDSRQLTENVATGWETENGGKTWLFTIRDDVTFHSGNALTAEDVAYSMNRIMEQNIGNAALWQGFIEPGSATARDETTVEFTTTKPYGPLLATMVRLFIVDSETVKANAEDGDMGQAFLNTDVAGSGSYQLPDPLQTGDPQEIPMEGFDDYWKGWEDDQFTSARMRKVKEESTIKALMKTGKAHMTDPVLSVSAYKEMDGYEKAKTITSSQFSIFHHTLHVQKPPTDDINVRKAFAHAFNSQKAIENIFFGGQEAVGVVPVGLPGHNDDLEPVPFDLEKAREFLDKSDYTVEEINEIGIEHVHVANISRQRKMALLFKNNMAELGVEVELTPLSWAQMTERVSKKKSTPHSMNLIYGSNYPSPDTFLYLPYHPDNKSSWHYASWLDKDELTTTIENARQTTDSEERTKLYKEAQRMVYEEYPGIYVVNQPLRITLNANVEGYAYRGVSGFGGDIHRMHWSPE